MRSGRRLLKSNKETTFSLNKHGYPSSKKLLFQNISEIILRPGRQTDSRNPVPTRLHGFATG